MRIARALGPVAATASALLAGELPADAGPAGLANELDEPRDWASSAARTLVERVIREKY